MYHAASISVLHAIYWKIHMACVATMKVAIYDAYIYSYIHVAIAYTAISCQATIKHVNNYPEWYI